MCGIVAYIGDKEAQPILLEGLLKLEYRGYDSAGIATLSHDPFRQHRLTNIKRSVGKIVNLQRLVENSPCHGNIGIAHTRWATHGRPSEANAHPHFARGISVVHNGIIENYRELRDELIATGAVFESETDTEVISHLIVRELDNNSSYEQSVRNALKLLSGAFAVAILNEKYPDTLICAKQSSPLVIGLDGQNFFIASDFPAALAYTRNFYILEDGDIATISDRQLKVSNFEGELQIRDCKTIQWSPMMAEKGGHPHFMHKEIFEQPSAVEDTLLGRLNFLSIDYSFDGLQIGNLGSFDRIVIVACGTSYHAAMIAKYCIEDFAHIPVETELASEFRYRYLAINERTLVIGISQSGETADTLTALKHAASLGAQIMGVCNVMDSAIGRLCQKSQGTLYTRAGIEIGVASTKAFVTQIAAMQTFALVMSHVRKSQNIDTIESHLALLATLPRLLEAVLAVEDSAKLIVRKYLHCNHMLYLGRGLLYPIALEGALKMKEISYIHAEGYAAGEMKHGPIALIDEEMPVVVLAVKGPGYEKVLGSIEEVKARGGKVIAIAHEGDLAVRALTDDVLSIPAAHPFLSPILTVVPLQLLAYHMAVLRGTDVDQPRNLAKSVTVE